MYNVRNYATNCGQKDAKTYIDQKIRQFTKEHPDNVEAEKFDNIKELAKMIKKIKNMEIMSQEEVNIRLKITEVQNTYQKKQDRLHRLKTPKKRPAKGAKGKIR